MSYSPNDFADDVMRKLYPEGLPEGFVFHAQASICIETIDRLQRFATQVVYAVQYLQAGHGFDAFVSRITTMAENLEDPIEEVAVELFNAFEESALSAPILLGCTLPEFCDFMRADDEDDRFGLTPEQFGAAQERAWTMMNRKPVKDTRAA